MPLSEILGWISRNGLAAFLIGCFLSGLAVTFANLLVRIARSITGHYPPPSPVSCNHERQCFCCRENGCQEGCGCYQEEDDGDEDEGEDE